MFQLVRSILFLMPAERAHYFTMNWLKFLLNLPIVKQIFLAQLKNSTYHKPTEIAGLTFHNPIGLAAGFDKNARYFNELHMLGFGFVEIGTVTPKPQDGNPQPRLFRLKKDEALINRMGFNNEGVDAVVERLKKGRIPSLILGGNIGKNKVTPNSEALSDYVICFEKLHEHVDYFVVNVSSPNTPGLRELQEKTFLTKLLNELKEINKKKGISRPIFFKIDPNLPWEKVDEMVEIVEETGIAGIITNNTSVDRSGLKTSTAALETIGAGGLSGAPIKDRSRAVLQRVLDQKKSDFVVISSGGISDASEPKHRFNQGAQLVQVWTGFIYKGPKLIQQALKKL
jgi:dihydroorotate dehydrogenase